MKRFPPAGKPEKPDQPSGFSKLLESQFKSTGVSAIASSSNPGRPNAMDNDFSDAIFLGKISARHPTVSHLLIDHPDFQSRCWQIVHAPQNRDKPYTRIPPGTPIYLRADRLELFWDTPTGEKQSATASEMATGGRHPDDPQMDPFSGKFVAAIKQQMGTRYDQVNCYELVVEGLRTLGYRYGGYGGIKEKLLMMAANQGQEPNTYLSGEGLIQATGRQAYETTLVPGAEGAGDLHAIIEEIKDILQPGQILSFSTPSRGHTGVIANKEGQWTYLNSGILDHNLTGPGPRKGVGEEALHLEIRNWIRRAARRDEPLTITIGSLDAQKLEKYKIVPWGEA